MQEHSVWLAFGLTAIAGLATGVGSVIALLAKRTNTKFLCASLGFSAGVMLFVSFVDIIPIAKAELIQELGAKIGFMTLLLAFFGGMGLIMLIDFLISEPHNPHEILGVEDMDKTAVNHTKLHRVGIVVALSLVIHNFPEGIATFTTAVSSGLEVAIPITLAIAIHNIPEGIAVSVPIYHATGNKSKAFWLSFLSGLTEPFGALMAFFFLMPYWSPWLNGIVMASVAGIMVYIALDELLPSAEKYGEHHISIMGLIAGMIVMALSLYLFV
jgi:ZIP family zinc transporter